MEEPGSSDVSDQEQQVEFAPIEEQEDIAVQKIQEVPNRTFADDISYDDISYDTEAVPFGEGEQATAIERTFGKNEFTDFFGDIYRAGVQGQAQGGTVDESLELMMKGGDASEEDVMDFIQAYKRMQQSGPSDEMNSFNKIYQDNGGGVLGFIKGVASNPTVVPQLFTSSVSAIVNPTVLGAAAVGAAGGTLAAGPIGTIGGAMFAAGTTLESALTFGELLEEALEGKPMTDENIRAVLEDPDKMRTIRAKSMGRGLAIGVIDGISGGLASKVTANVAKATAKAGKTASRLTGAAAGGGVEVVGGSSGEVAGRLVAGQEMDIAEIGFEGIAGTATAPITVGYGLYKAAKNPGKYEVNGRPANRADIIEVLDSNDPDAIAGVELTIENDPELKARAEKAKNDVREEAQIKQKIQEAGITDQAQIDELTALEKERKTVANNDTKAGQKRKQEIDNRIDEILDQPAVEQEIDQSVTQEEQTIETQEEDASTQQSPVEETVTVESETTEEVAPGVPDQVQRPAREGDTQTEGVESTQTQEEITQESQDLETLINDSPVEVTSQETTEVTEESPAPQREVNDNLNVVDEEKTDSYYKSERFNTENPNTNQQQHESMLMDRANKAVKAIQKILPNTKVVLHRSEDSYSQYIDTPSRGAFEPNTNTIHINMPKATGKTIAHEVLHAVLKQKLGAEVNIQNASKNMVDSVKKAIAKSKKLTPEQIAEFDTYANQFDSDVKNEEYLTNVVGFLAENYTKLDAPEKSAVKKFVQKIADFVNEKFGTDINVADFTQSDRDVVDLLNAIAEKTTEGTEISETDLQALEEGGSINIGLPSEIKSTDKTKTELVFKAKAPELSFVTDKDKIDITSLIKDIQDKKQKVWFWTADQLGRGDYADLVINDKHYLDAGPSYALDPSNKKDGVIWASGMKKKGLENNIAKSDYIFLISGSPQRSKLYNRRVSRLLQRRVEQVGDFKQFKQEIFDSKPVKAFRDILAKYDSFDDLINIDNSDRKVFLLAIEAESKKKNTPLKNTLEKFNAFLDFDSLRDGFYKDNNFEMNDVMLVLKPTEIGGKSKHSTYEFDIMGEVVGVPDKKINAADIMTGAAREKLKDVTRREQQAQVIAPYGSGVREVQAPTKTEAFTTDDTITFKVQKKRIFNETPKAYTFLTTGYGGKFINLPKSQIKVRDTEKKLGAMGQDIGESGLMVEGNMPSWLYKRNPEVQEIRGFEVVEDKRKMSVDKEGKIKTEAFDKNTTVEDVVKIGRDNNFSDASIQDYLVRVKKMKVKDAKELLSINADLFSKMPPSFGNMKGGAKSGVRFFKKVKSFMDSLQKRNKKSKNALTKAEMMDQTIEYMEAQPEYQAEGTGKTIESTQQKEMIMGLQKSLQVNPTKNMNTRIRKMRSDIMERRRGAKGLQDVKRKLRNFMRQTLPKDVYTKSNVMDMVRKITNATEKNVDNLMNEVFDFVTERQVKSLTSKIDSILNGTYEIVQAGRRKGTKIDSDTRERLEAIRDAVSDDAIVADDIVNNNIKLNKEFNELSQKDIQTDADRSRMADILTIMAINNSKLMDNTDINKVESLSRAESILSGIIGEGRQTLKDQMAKDHKRYIKEFELLYEDVTGNKIDMSSDESVAQMKKDARSLTAKKRKLRTQKAIPRLMRKIMLGISGFINASESLSGLMDKISTLPGDLFGGRAKRLVYDKVNESSTIYKRRMMENQTILIDKVKEIYGKKWRSKSKKNAAPVETGVLNSDGKEIILSPNQIGYLYMQYQDPANLPSFESEDNVDFGPDHSRIMKELVDLVDPEVIELAQWQQNEFFPSLYDHYNDSYKKIYRTNLPWNKYYGGRIYREGVSPDPLDLLGDKTKLNSQVGSASTKVRQKNSKPIQPMDMMDSLQTYLTDMEWFAAYGPNIRDINKLFGNPMMRRAITDVHGESTMMLIDDAIKKIASRGIQSTRKNAVINAMNNVFVLSRLGINPTVMLKQLTSIPTYANDIGIVNYLKYGFKNVGSMIDTYKEIRDNSVYMQDRGFTDVRKVIESYSDKQMQSFVPNQTKNWFVNAMMYFTKFGDRAAIFIGGMPNYSYYKADFKKKNPKATEQQAIDYAIKKFENDTKNTQQSSDLQDKDYYQTSDPITRSFNMFLTTPKQYLRKEISAVRNLYRKIKAMDPKAGKGTIGENLRQVAMYHFAMPMLFQYVALGLPGILRDRREGDEEDLARAAIIGNLNALFIVGDLFNTAGDLFTKKPWASSPKSIALLETSATFARLIERIEKTKNPEKKAELSNKLFLEAVSLTGIPAANLNKLSKNYQKLIDGGEDPGKALLRLFNFSDYVIEGPGKKTKVPAGGFNYDEIMYDNENTYDDNITY